MLAGFAHAEAPQRIRDYSPIIVQELGSEPSADEFTRVDYDGDWDPENNWENLNNFPRPRTVYYSLVETKTRAYLTYAFFFPRDYSRFCFWIHCHENDFEGMRVTVDKTKERPILLEALAHNNKNEVNNPSEIRVVIEAAAHGVYPPDVRTVARPNKVYGPADYELRPLSELWEKRKTSLFKGEFKFRGRTYPERFGGDNWIIFGLGSAKPSWSWDIRGSGLEKGEWFLDPARGEMYLNHSIKN